MAVRVVVSGSSEATSARRELARGRPVLGDDDDPVWGDLDPVVGVGVGQVAAGAQPLALAQDAGDVGRSSWRAGSARR